MRLSKKTQTFTAVLAASLALATDAYANGHDKNNGSVQLGPRPFYLVGQMSEGDLKERLEQGGWVHISEPWY